MGPGRPIFRAWAEIYERGRSVFLWFPEPPLLGWYNYQEIIAETAGDTPKGESLRRYVSLLGNNRKREPKAESNKSRIISVKFKSITNPPPAPPPWHNVSAFNHFRTSLWTKVGAITPVLPSNSALTPENISVILALTRRLQKSMKNRNAFFCKQTFTS